MTTFAEISLELAVEAPACPRPIWERAVRNAALELCTQAYVWKATLSASNTLNSGNLTYTPPSGARIQNVLTVRDATSNDNLFQVHREDLELFNNANSWEQAIGTPRFWTYLSEGSVRLAPTPIGTASYSARVALVPALDATSLPTDIATRHHLALQYGARAYVFSMAGTPWGDLAAAGAAQAQFRRLRNLAKLEHFKDVYGAMRTVQGPSLT